MDPHSEVEDFLKQYQDLPEPSRQSIWRRILEQLPPQDWREIKTHAERLPPLCDIFGKLPLEIASLIAENLPLIDIIRLRRVSRQWNSILSSPSLCRAAWRATGGGPIASPASTSESGHEFIATFNKLVRRRDRLERGDPHEIRSFPYRFNFDEDLGVDPDFFYSDGVLAWIQHDGGENDYTKIVVVNLVKGTVETITTDDEDELFRVQNAGPIVVAIGWSSHCYVWNLDTKESSFFPIPRSDFGQILISGDKVVLEFKYLGFAIHWSLATKIARTFPLGPDVVALAPHPFEDKITTVEFVPQESPATSFSPIYKTGMIYQLQKVVESAPLTRSGPYASHSDPVLQMPFPGHWMKMRGDPESGLLREIISGQASLIDKLGQEGPFSRMSALVSVEPDGVVAVHTFPAFHKFSQILCPERGIIYGVMPSEWGTDLVILKANRIPSPSCVWYDYALLHREPVSKCLGLVGDAQFVILLFKRKLEIWAMDETPGLEKVSRLWK